ncbi:hypothetical protein SSYRP_v1c03700 [Spiroplasma syrphidicola EA-1]|uniref:Transmembrane protein n=1 Tax=Spiroplasma syrphidicola EA-1 TaxID=1276229 RepID=R4UDH6_9MOLU|nr:hypothetical protein [Spiroplasma syrphidicola]AGM25964.1 hypothetical protein SSYRP_v1c03700 [Spiroplasma syrphidicola EA-1]
MNNQSKGNENVGETNNGPLINNKLADNANMANNKVMSQNNSQTVTNIANTSTGVNKNQVINNQGPKPAPGQVIGSIKPVRPGEPIKTTVDNKASNQPSGQPVKPIGPSNQPGQPIKSNQPNQPAQPGQTNNNDLIKQLMQENQMLKNQQQNNIGPGFNNGFLTPLSNPMQYPGPRMPMMGDQYNQFMGQQMFSPFAQQGHGPGFNQMGMAGGPEQSIHFNKPIYQAIVYQPYVLPPINNGQQQNMQGMNMYDVNPQSLSINPLNLAYGQQQNNPYYLNAPSANQFQTAPGYQQQQYPQQNYYQPNQPPVIGQDSMNMGYNSQQFVPENQGYDFDNYNNDNLATDNHFAIMNPELSSKEDYIDQWDDVNNMDNEFINDEDQYYSDNYENDDNYPADYNDGYDEDLNSDNYDDLGADNYDDLSPENDALLTKKELKASAKAKKVWERDQKRANKKKLPLWAKIIISLLVILVVAVGVLTIVYFNVPAFQEIVNGWFGITKTFNPWF